jgi:hypothetical protein
MIAFTIQVSQNPFLAPGADLVHAVVSVSAAADPASRLGARPLVEGLLVDCSQSMEGARIEHAKSAVARAIDLLREDAWFFVVKGTETGRVVAPLAQATPGNKKAAREEVRGLLAGGGTAMSTWLRKALEEFQKMPAAIHHAILLTDGKNEGEPDDRLLAALGACEGAFQCDARGIGTDWSRDQVRLISSHLLGTVDIIPRPADIEADFRKLIEGALGKAATDVRLRLWTPQGAGVQLCGMVYPEKVDLTGRASPVAGNPQARDYPTGSWGAEKRDYHVSIRVNPARVGQRMCAGRVSLVTSEGGQEAKLAEGMILATWTEDEAQSAVIHPAVAHYTGQAELADAIQGGLKAREAGDAARAEALLGRAVQIAAETNPQTMLLLEKVVEVEDAKQGTVKLRKGVKKEDEFALDTRSTKTARVAKGS